MEPEIKITKHIEGGEMWLSMDIILENDTVSIFPWRDGCHIISKLNEDLFLL